MKRGGKKRAKVAKKRQRAPKRSRPRARARAASAKKIARPPRPAKQNAKPRAAKPRPSVAKQAARPAVDFERELKRERATRRRLEKRLTALVQELGQIRIYEVRCGVLEEELRRRDEELATLRRPAGPEPAPAQAELPLAP